MLKKILLILLFGLFYWSKISSATNYYVSPSGSNTNNGLTINSAYQTLNFAANQTVPGDTVFVLNGLYTYASSASNVLDIYNSGTESNGIVYMNYPGHTPIIKLNANNWSGIALQGADYITIDGFQIIGNNDDITLDYALAEYQNTNNPSTSGNGIGITREYNNDSNKPHHNTIRNCNISKCGGAGIYTYRADYTTIEYNTISECAWYAPYGNSGISLYQNWNSDSALLVRNYIVGNICYRNENYIPFIAVGSITDGNGIIVDDGRNTQNDSDQGFYLGGTYIANNLIFDNGGRGIHCYLSDNIYVVNNTCYKNCQSPAIQDGEFTAYASDSIYFINNIAEPDGNISPIDVSSNLVSLIVDHNLWASNQNLANPNGDNTVTGNPNFISATSDPLLANFRLQATSSAINAGSNLNAPGVDLEGNLRFDAVDLGCYEYQIVISSSSVQTSANEFKLFPNPAVDQVNLGIEKNFNSKADFTVFDATGRKIKQCEIQADKQLITIDVSEFSTGIYFIRLLNHDNQKNTFKSFQVIR